MTRFWNALTVALITLFLGTGAAWAVCEKERAAAQSASLALLDNEQQRQVICSDLRLCKDEARLLNRDCKQDARGEKFACLQECNLLSGRAKRQCKQDCRANKRSAKASCRIAKRAAVAECREDGSECRKLRREAVDLVIRASAATEALYSCIQEADERGEVKTEADQELLKDALDAAK